MAYEGRAYRGQSAVAFPDRGAAADQPDEEEQSSPGYDHYSGDESVHVFKEVVVVVVSDEHVRSHIAQDAGCPLQKTRSECW